MKLNGYGRVPRSCRKLHLWNCENRCVLSRSDLKPLVTRSLWSVVDLFEHVGVLSRSDLKPLATYLLWEYGRSFWTLWWIVVTRLLKREENIKETLVVKNCQNPLAGSVVFLEIIRLWDYVRARCWVWSVENLLICENIERISGNFEWKMLLKNNFENRENCVWKFWSKVTCSMTQMMRRKIFGRSL